MLSSQIKSKFIEYGFCDVIVTLLEKIIYLVTVIHFQAKLFNWSINQYLGYIACRKELNITF